jgi:hypothetical protein
MLATQRRTYDRGDGGIAVTVGSGGDEESHDVDGKCVYHKHISYIYIYIYIYIDLGVRAVPSRVVVVVERKSTDLTCHVQVSAVNRSMTSRRHY